jgi:CRP/FNR family transcriptional regulator
MTISWIDSFPSLAHLDATNRRRLLEGARQVPLPAGTVLFREGELCENFLLVVDGVVRVQKVSENGREIVLYRVETGESCILTTSCLIGAERYTASGVVESEVRGVVVPQGLFHELLGTSKVFRSFVFDSFAVRLADLLVLIEEVAFGRIDTRLAQTLLDKAGGEGRVVATHQELAVELGTAREVVSRQLKDFERRGWVSLSRGRVDLQSPAELRALAEKRGN